MDESKTETAQEMSYTVSFNQEDNAFITKRALKRGKTPEEQIKDSAIGKGGNKRKKDIDTQRELANITELNNKLQRFILEDKPYSDLLELSQCIGKEIITICQF